MPNSPISGKCSVCDHDCASYTPRAPLDPESLCYCGHGTTQHLQPVLTAAPFPPRGGLQINNISCLGYRTIHNAPITYFRQPCAGCTLGYSSHNPLASTPSSAASFSTPHLPQLPPVQPSPLASFSRPAPLLTSRLPQATMSSSSSPPNSWPSLPQYAPSAIVTPYSRNPRFTTPPGLSPFGVPHAGIPMSTTTGRSRVRANRKVLPYSATKPNKPLNEKLIDIVLFPNDINFALENPDSIEDIFEETYLRFPRRIHAGERLASDLAGLQALGLVHRMTLTASSRQDNVMHQLYDTILLMATSHHLQFPPSPENSFELEISAPNRELRILYQQLPFRLLKIGYQMPRGHYLSYDASESWRDYSYSAICKRASRVQHPSDPNVGLLVLCPKHSPLVGPICPPSLEQHSCFADHAFKILIDGDDEESSHQGLEDDKPLVVECKTFCPLSSRRRTQRIRRVIVDEDRNIGDENSVNLSYSTSPDQASTLSDRESTPYSMSTPSHRASTPPDDSAPVFPNSPVRIPTPSLSPINTSLLLAPAVVSSSSREIIDLTLGSPHNLTVDDSPSRPSTYVPSEPPRYRSLLDVHDSIKTTFPGDVQRTMFHVRGPTVEACSNGLIDFLIHRRHHPDAPYNRSSHVNNRFSILPANQKLANIFGQHWIFRAGYEGAHDASGEGVMRQVLTQAITTCLKPELAIAQPMDHDGFHVLRIRDFPSLRDLDHAFALGALCAMILIRGHISPDPVSPALLIAVICGVQALVDMPWIQIMFPDSYSNLALLPSSPQSLATLSPAQHAQLNTLVQSTIDSSLSHLALISDNQWPAVVQSLYTGTLLGVKPDILSSSPLFQAFQAGFDVPLSATDQSMIQVLRSSAKFLATECYNRRITNGEQVIAYLDFVVCGDTAFRTLVAPLVLRFRNVLEGYLRGTGHPAHPLIEDLIDAAQRAVDDADPAYRARCFVKLLSGISLLPPSGRMFTINVQQNVLTSAHFNNQYHRDNDLLPPSMHACTYTMDVWFNTKLISVLQNSPLDESHVADLEFMLHSTMFEAGIDNFT